MRKIERYRETPDAESPLTPSPRPPYRPTTPFSTSISRRGNSGLHATRERYRALFVTRHLTPVDCNIRHIICHRAAYRGSARLVSGTRDLHLVSHSEGERDSRRRFGIRRA